MSGEYHPFDKHKTEQALRLRGVEVTAERLDMLERYASFLYEQSRKINLTGSSVFSGDEFISHVITSTAPLWRDGTEDLFLFDTDRPLKVIDIGSGQGMPGMIVKIFAPRWNVTLLDANGKKTRFLEEALDAAGFSGGEQETLHVICARAEELAREADHRAVYDLALSRAVASLTVVAEYALPFLRPGGRLLYWGTGNGPDGSLSEKERSGLNTLGGEGRVFQRKTNHNDHEGWASFVDVHKTGETPDKYPRRTGIPKKRPL